MTNQEIIDKLDTILKEGDATELIDFMTTYDDRVLCLMRDGVIAQEEQAEDEEEDEAL